MTHETMRAYDVQYLGYFEALNAYACRAHGHAYRYTPKPNHRRREQYQNAVIVLPEGAPLQCGEVLCNEGGYCEIVYSCWVSPP